MSVLDWSEPQLPEFLSAWSLDGLLSAWPAEGRARTLSLLFLLLLSLLIYLLYYLTCAVNRPLLVAADGHLLRHLLLHCPLLLSRYWPPPWALSPHVSTLFRAIMFRKAPIQYHRTILTLSDGGELAMDWAEWSGHGHQEIPRDAPVLFVLAGITGSSEDDYVKQICVDGLSCGYRPVVFNQRGTAGVVLKTHRAYSSTKIDDMQCALNAIHVHFPSSPIVGVGVSLGGMILTQYLHRTGCHGDLSGVLVVSCPWNVFQSHASLEGNWVNRWLYSYYLSSRLKKMVLWNLHRMNKELRDSFPCDFPHIMKSTAISHVDERLTCPIFGYHCLDDYYREASNYGKVHRIQTPLLCLTSYNDPFVPPASLPLKEFASNPHTVLILTSHGGHNGFLEGLWPSRHTYVDRVCRQFLVAMTTYQPQQSCLATN